MPRRPTEHGLDAINSRDERGRIARTPARDPHIEIDAGDLFINDFEHRATFAIAAISGEAFAAFAQIVECLKMRRNEIGDLNIIADTLVR